MRRFADEVSVRASNVIPFPLPNRALCDSLLFPVVRRRPTVLVMPEHSGKTPERNWFDEFEVWSRRFGRRVFSALGASKACLRG